VTSFGDYDAYEDFVEEALRDLPGSRRLLFGWSVCQHLYGVIDRLGAAEVSMRDGLEELLDEGWQRLVEGRQPAPDAVTLERLVPTDDFGVGLGGPGVSEVSELGRCMSRFSDAGGGDAVPVGRVAADAVSALWDYGDAEETEVSMQRGLADALRRMPDLPVEEVRRLARQAGTDLGEQVRVFVAG
jgi:hypothetical protein